MGNKLTSFSLKDIGDLFCSCNCTSRYRGTNSPVKAEELKEMNSPTTPTTPTAKQPQQYIVEHVWVPITVDDQLPDDAVEGGCDKENCCTYVARVNSGENKVKTICEFIPEKNVAYSIVLNAVEKCEGIEVLVGKNYKWVPLTRGQCVPRGAVKESSFYVGRTDRKKKATVIGQLHVNRKSLRYHWKDKVAKSDNYEVLVQKRLN